MRLDHDIVNFCVHLQEDEEVKQTMKVISGLDFSRFYRTRYDSVLSDRSFLLK